MSSSGSVRARDPKPTRVRILLADDHEIVRRGVRSLLEDRNDLQIVGEAATGWEAVAQAKELKPDVVVLDISMPDLNGLEATREILAILPRSEVLILTRHESEELARGALEAGARGYILKSDAGRDLVSAVEAMAQHKPFFTSRISEIILDGYLRNREPESPVHSLTHREREIVQLLAEGKSNKEIGNILVISFKTVATHRATIMQKLNFHCLSDLIHYAIRNKIVEP
jgi:DNA-binding NarL/FixJ family response regulator